MLQLNGKCRWKKKWVICLVSIFHSWVMVLKLSKKVDFLQFCAAFSNKSYSVKAINIYASGSSNYTLSENNMPLFVRY